MLGFVLSMSLLFVLPGSQPQPVKTKILWRCCVGAPANSRFCR